MILAPPNDSLPVSSSPSPPSTPRPHHTGGESGPQDKSEIGFELSGGTPKKNPPSAGSQPTVDATHDVQLDADSSQPPETTSAFGNQPESNQNSTTTSGFDKTDAKLGAVSPPQTESYEGSHQNTSSDDDSASDGYKYSPQSSSPTQKRPPDTILHGPTKRARTSAATCVSPIVTPASESLGSHSNDKGFLMRDTRVTTVNTDTEANRQEEVDPAPSSVANSQLTSEPNSGSDSNLVPSLSPLPEVASTSNTPSQPQSPDPSKGPVQDKSPQAKPTTTSTSSLANNPYFALSTAFLKGSPNSTTTAYNPYSLYYGPGTPIGPHAPTYPYSYFYQVHSPVSAAMYPTSPNFVTSPTQKSPSPLTPTGAESQRQRPKRLKAHTVTSGNHNIPIVPRDKRGKPMLPLNVGIMTVISLGEVCMREHFHTERYIFPVGYEVTRRYLSTVDSNAEVVYHCTILDGGDGPKFQIVPSDAPGREVIAGTATGAWSSIVKQANAIRSRQHSNSVSGPDFFGLGQNTIKHLIQELPNADRLKDYVWQNFIEGGPLGGRHAAVTPALPEDYDSTLPIGALYPAERDRLKREIAASPRGLNHYPQHIIAQAEAQGQRKDLGAAQLPGQQASASQQILSPEVALSVSNGHVGVSPNSSGQLLGPGAVISSSQPSPPAPLHTQGSSSSVPTTIASIMSAYPAPAATPPVTGSSSTPPSTSASSLPS